MKRPKLYCLIASLGLGCALSTNAFAANTTDAQLVVTYTLDNVLINGTTPATFETTSEVGDIIFEDFGPNGSTFGGGAGGNPPASVGSNSAGLMYSLNGLDPFVDDYDPDSFGIGDSLIVTMDVSASATTPGSLFFAQVSDESTFYFSHFLDPADFLVFQFSWEAHLTGTLDNTAHPGTALALAEGVNVSADVDSVATGSPYSFDATTNFFDIFEINPPNTLGSPDVTESGTFDVVFAPGDNILAINLNSVVVVNASVEVPEPGSLALLGLGGLLIARRRR